MCSYMCQRSMRHACELPPPPPGQAGSTTPVACSASSQRAQAVKSTAAAPANHLATHRLPDTPPHLPPAPARECASLEIRTRRARR